MKETVAGVKILARKSRYWFHPIRTIPGWHANLSASARRRAIARRARRTGWLSAARALQALANVTQSVKTRNAARSDALWAYEQYRKRKMR